MEKLWMGEAMIMLATPTPDYQSPKHHKQVCVMQQQNGTIHPILSMVFSCMSPILKHTIVVQKKWVLFYFPG